MTPTPTYTIWKYNTNTGFSQYKYGYENYRKARAACKKIAAGFHSSERTNTVQVFVARPSGIVHEEIINSEYDMPLDRQWAAYKYQVSLLDR